jgi:hypothetical protein
VKRRLGIKNRRPAQKLRHRLVHRMDTEYMKKCKHKNVPTSERGDEHCHMGHYTSVPVITLRGSFKVIDSLSDASMLNLLTVYRAVGGTDA